MLPDYHLHTWRCGHASGQMEDYIKVARLRGLTEIGFADHLPQYWLSLEERDPGLAMGVEEIPLYIAEVTRLQEQNHDIIIRLGVEADYIPSQEKKLAELLALFPFDYVIGSVHYLDGWGFDNPSMSHEYDHRDIEEMYNAYFLILQQAALTGLFDIMAHPDLIKKFGYRPVRDLTSLYEKTAQVFAQAGVCVEINTAGLRAPVAEVYPSLSLLKLFKKYEVPVVFGSDAHSPEQAGQGWEMALEFLKEAGYRKVVQFKRRCRQIIFL